jgi:hypothetical protein
VYLYIFAEKFNLKDLADRTMDIIQQLFARLEPNSEADSKLALKAYDMSQSSFTLRKFFSQALIYDYWCETGWDFHKAGKGRDALINNKGVDEIWELSRNRKSFHRDLMVHLQKFALYYPDNLRSQDPSLPPISTPLNRHWDPSRHVLDPCYFHCPAKSEDCYKKTRGEI